MHKEAKQSNNRTTKKLIFVALGMFGFGYALVPLYDVMCEALGVSSRFVDLKKVEQATSNKDMNRLVTVEFATTVNRGLDWEFHAMQNSVQVHPGVINEVKFYAKNLQNHAVIAQAIPSIVPPRAQKYFSKLECFCFSQQTFKAGEIKEMPLRFYVDPHMPKDIGTVSLAYTFFDTKKTVSNTEDKKLTNTAGL